MVSQEGATVYIGAKAQLTLLGTEMDFVEVSGDAWSQKLGVLMFQRLFKV